MSILELNWNDDRDIIFGLAGWLAFNFVGGFISLRFKSVRTQWIAILIACIPALLAVALGSELRWLAMAVSTAGLAFGLFAGSILPLRRTLLAGSSLCVVASVLAAAWLISDLQARIEAEEKNWGAPPHGEAELITRGIQAVVNESFLITAINGKFVGLKSSPHTIADLAAWIFSQRLGASLQPGSNFAGAQTAAFAPDLAALKWGGLMADGVTRIVETRGKLVLCYQLRLITTPPRERQWSESLEVSCRGRVNTRTGQLLVDEIVLPQ